MASSLPFLKNGAARIGFIVKNLDETVERCRRLCGIGPWHFYAYQRPLLRSMSRRGAAADYRMRIALANIGPLRMELIEEGEGATIYREHIENHGYGVHHFGVLVDDIECTLAAAEKAGYRMTLDGAGFGLDGDGRYAYIDTEEDLGITREPISRTKRRVPPERVYPPEE
jgi:hypothetical protein